MELEQNVGYSKLKVYSTLLHGYDNNEGPRAVVG